MSTSIATSIELPVGYTVVDRLGAGGYGEVWKATAPGGVEKAIKIVFGHCEEGMAERELKSLERIRSVRHPFVLSIERYEIVNNRLVIVTELADMSLSDCFQKCLNDGHAGIPRDQLIAYMWDAAEALDCLVEQHSLQHLDIKPENLLVVGDHIKVADFGLVKELASKTLNSMMGGMTPLYSAPEIYDNNPTKFSDQYSLAIVYQQMLTGSLPFPGRTPAQLAKQHTLSEPNLNQLNEGDRRIVGKALEKVPTDRFANCREFVTALRSVGQGNSDNSRISSGTEGKQHPNELENDDTKSASLLDTKHMEDPVCATATRVLSDIKDIVASSTIHLDNQPAKAPLRKFPRVESTIEDIETPEFDPTATTQSVPTLFVGVGGMGIKMLRTIRNQAEAHDVSGTMAWLAIDTERDTLKAPADGESHDPLSSEEKLHIPLRRPNEYREESQALLRWVSRRWLYNIPRSLQTRGFRPLGRIAVVDHAAEVFAALHSRLQWLATNDPSLAENPGPIHVALLSGMCGGTGGGTIIDLAQAIRSICHEFSQEVVIHGVLASTYSLESTDSLAAANMYSLLTELNHTQQSGNCGESPPPGTAARYELPQGPFDEIFTVAMPTRSERASCDLTLQSIADSLLLEASGRIKPALEAIRSKTESSSEHAYLRTLSCIHLGQLAGLFRSIHQQQLSRALVEHWLSPCHEDSDCDVKYFCQYASSLFAKTVLSQYPKPLPKVSESMEETGPSPQETLRTEKIKCIASAFAEFVESFETQNPSDQPPLEYAEVQSASKRILATLSAILQSHELQEAQLVQTLSELLADEVKNSAETSSASNPAELAASALSLLEMSPLNCGLQRRTILVTPGEQQAPELLETFKEACPTIADCKTTVTEPHLLREGSGLHPLHLGARLAEMYPDIDEAGGRLHTRRDIDWRDLRDQ